MRDLEIRKARQSDLNAIIEMQLSLQKHLENSSPLIWRYTEEKEELIRRNLEVQLADENHLILIAEVKGEIVGFAHGEVQHRTTHLPNIIGSIATIYVHENYRRRGIGSNMIQEICKFFRSKNAKDVYLRYVLGNKEGERFWENLGFQPILVTTHSQIDIIEKRITHSSTHEMNNQHAPNTVSEYLDIVDENDRIVGSKNREKIHRNGVGIEVFTFLFSIQKINSFSK